MAVEDVLVLGKDEASQRLPGQIASGHAEQTGPREVGLQDQTLFADGEVAHRRKIVKIKIPCPRGFEFALRPPQLLVLHLQFELMHLQFVEQPLGFLGRNRFPSLGLRAANQFFRPAAQVGDIVRVRLFLSHAGAPCLQRRGLRHRWARIWRSVVTMA